MKTELPNLLREICFILDFKKESRKPQTLMSWQASMWTLQKHKENVSISQPQTNVLISKFEGIVDDFKDIQKEDALIITWSWI